MSPITDEQMAFFEDQGYLMVRGLLDQESVLDAVECFIGPEIYSNPVQHVRIKLPEHLTPINPNTGRIQLGISPWHQDNGVVTKEADDTDMLTVWFSLKEATVEQGCLTVIPESHRGGLLHHCPDIWGLEIPEKVKDRSAAVPLPLVASEQEQRDPVELRPALQPHRPGLRAGRLSRIRGPQPGPSGAGPDRSRGVEPDVAGCQGRPRRSAQPVLQPVEQGPRALRVGSARSVTRSARPPFRPIPPGTA